MLKFAEENEILVRGHTVLWDDPKMQPSWVKKIKDPEDLMNVTLNRINSVMKRYKGKVTGWDVVTKICIGITLRKCLLDPDVTLFVNEYNTIENPGGVTATPVKEKMEEILAYQGNENIKGAIGAQGHFSPTQPNLAYMRSALDTLGSLGLPVWITELDMPKCPNQAKYMEEILREAYSHPAVEGIIIFAGPELTLADKDFSNTETGDVIDKLLKEWHQKNSEIPNIFTVDHENEKEDSEDTTVEIWVDSVSLQPFTQEGWNAHHEQTIHKTRKGAMRIRAVNSAGEPVPNATISIVQNRLGFSFGCEVEKNILGNQAYQNWFTKRFTVTTFANEMKWYSTEAVRGKEDYTTADTMLRFFKQHGVAVRGHNIVWNDPKYQLS
ncbi:hypothetical protein Bca4012_080848 [Brassica carinata]